MKSRIEPSFFNSKKNVIIKHIGSDKSREPNHSFLLSKYVWNGFKYIFTIKDHFSMYGWNIPLNDSKAETILRVWKWVTAYNIPGWLQTGNGGKFENDILKNSELKSIARIYGALYNSQIKGQRRHSTDLL